MPVENVLAVKVPQTCKNLIGNLFCSSLWKFLLRANEDIFEKIPTSAVLVNDNTL